MKFGVDLVGDTRVSERFDRFPEEARAQLVDRIGSVTAKLEAAVRAAVPVRTGKLLATVRSGTENNPKKVRGWVSMAGGSKAEVLKALALEFGSHRQIDLKTFTRTVDHVFGIASAPYQQLVEAHTRNTDIVAQRFLRDPLAAMASEALEQIKDAVAAAGAAVAP